MKTLVGGSIISLAAVFAYMGTVPQTIYVLLAAQVLDIAAGVTVSYGNRTLASAIAESGVRKKVYAWIIIMLVAILQFEISDYFDMRIMLNYTPLEVACLGFVVAEAMSILENAEKIGIPLPSWLTRGLATAQGSFEGSKDKDESIQDRSDQ